MNASCQWMGDADSSISGRMGSRALSAYWKSAKDGEQLAQPCTPALYLINGRHYVVLANNSQILAVYRIKNDDVLRRLKRYPACLKAAIEG